MAKAFRVVMKDGSYGRWFVVADDFDIEAYKKEKAGVFSIIGVERVEEGAAPHPVLQVFASTENPTTCPYCGSRTDFLDRGGLRLHWCLDDACRFIFLEEDDDEEEEGQGL